MESSDNMRFVHEEAIKPDSLYAKKPLEWFIGRLVKIAFQSADSWVEHMWVKVNKVQGHDLVGTLENYPAFVTHLGYGDQVTINRTQIEAINLTLEEWWAEVTLLKSDDDYFNFWRGHPQDGNGFEVGYDEGLTPRQALKRWRNWVPTEK